MAIFFHIMYFNSVYGLPNKTVKIEEEPLLGVEVGLWCNLGRCFLIFAISWTDSEYAKFVYKTLRTPNYFSLIKYGLLV